MHEVAINEMKVLIAIKIGQSRDYMTKQTTDPAEALSNMTAAEFLQNQISDLSFACRILEDDAEEKGKSEVRTRNAEAGYVRVSLCLLSSVLCLLFFAYLSSAFPVPPSAFSLRASTSRDLAPGGITGAKTDDLQSASLYRRNAVWSGANSDQKINLEAK